MDKRAFLPTKNSHAPQTITSHHHQQQSQISNALFSTRIASALLN